ncbi:MAG: YHYH protein, partial [Phycisphaerae bacterium]|nr:YHYH protein [Phycisphaerae bacterium]
GFEVVGDVTYGRLSADAREHAGWGVRLHSAGDRNGDKNSAGAVTTTVKGITPATGRWYRLRIRGLAQEGFAVEKEDLYLKVEFFKDGGRTALDMVKQTVYAQVERDRKDLLDPGTNRKLGNTTWRSFALEFRTPFPEINTLRVSAGFNHGVGKTEASEFRINEFELTQIADPGRYAPRGQAEAQPVTADNLVHLGGRWYFDPRDGSRQLPKQFDHTNADQLLYRTHGFIAPFAGNTTAWLRTGYLDIKGKMVEKDQFVPDNVVIELNKTHLIIQSKNLPNHPTAVFPDRWRSLDGNPNYIGEQRNTWHLPFEPTPDPKRVAMKDQNNNDHALPMGPIGVATNGVMFFNPFDHLQDEDAVWRLDRCCGHPAGRSQYHYHKYPVCTKTPWADDGTGHSPVLGFAFDGYPVYGPYEADGELARESKSNPLNEFNVHKDPVRGWHYHVTPGAFPHIIGGYWGVPEAKNKKGPGPGGDRRRGPRRGRPGPEPGAFPPPPRRP